MIRQYFLFITMALFMDGLTLHLYSIRISDQMFTSLFRLGPLVLLQIVFVSATFIVWLIEQLPSCYYYTLGYLSLITFLIEMVASLRMIKQHMHLRKEYISQRVKESNPRYYARLVWDNINILYVIMLLYYSLGADGVLLSSTSSKVKSNTLVSDSQNCEFTLFALCLFTQLQKTLNNDVRQDLTMMWLLYAASTFLTTVLCVIFSKQYYHYCSSLKSNRRLITELGTINQTLMDCHIFSISPSANINQSLRQQIGTCPICLHEIIDSSSEIKQKVIRLRCSHLFHQTCIDKWLQVKDHCPFRCSISD